MKQKIRIAHVTQAMGGVKTHIKYIIDYADPELFAFEIVAPEDEDFMAFAKKRGIPYHVVHFERNISPGKDLGALLRLRSLVKKQRYDILHLHSAKAGILGRLVGRLTGTKTVFTPNGFSYLGARGWKRTVFFAIETFFRNSATRLFAVSNCEANRALYELGMRPEKVVVIQNAILPFEAEQQHTPGPVRIISTIGRLTAQKNLVRFVEIARTILKRHPEVEFRILGAGYHDDQKEEIQGLIKHYKLEEKLRIIEWSYQMDIRNYLSETDIYVSTSIFEGLPYSILEAMSLGIPCVASNCDGNMDIISANRDGFLCNSNSAFEAVISKLIEEPALRAQVSSESIRTVQQHFDIRRRKEQISTEYKKIQTS